MLFILLLTILSAHLDAASHYMQSPHLDLEHLDLSSGLTTQKLMGEFYTLTCVLSEDEQVLASLRIPTEQNIIARNKALKELCSLLRDDCLQALNDPSSEKHIVASLEDFAKSLPVAKTLRVYDMMKTAIAQSFDRYSRRCSLMNIYRNVWEEVHHPETSTSYGTAYPATINVGELDVLTNRTTNTIARECRNLLKLFPEEQKEYYSLQLKKILKNVSLFDRNCALQNFYPVLCAAWAHASTQESASKRVFHECRELLKQLPEAHQTPYRATLATCLEDHTIAGRMDILVKVYQQLCATMSKRI